MPAEKGAIPLASLVIFTRNRVDFLRLQLNAAINQTEQDLEILVMDNGSTDGTAAFMATCRDPRVRYVHAPFNRGPAKNYSLAVKRARGHFVLLAHDDDILHPELVRRQIETLRAYPDAMAAFANASLIDEHGRIVQPRLLPVEEDHYFAPGAYIEAWLRQSLWLPFPSMMLRRPWPPCLFTEKRWKAMGSLADIALACSLNRTAALVLVADPLFHYRQHSQQANRQKDSTKWATRLHQHLERSLEKAPNLDHLLPEIRVVLLRYRAQRRVIRATEPLARARRLRRDLDALFARHRLRKDPPIWHFGLAQMALLVHFLDLRHAPDCGDAPAEDPFGRWLQAARDGGGVSAGLRVRGLQRVAILGSMLNGFLLATDLRQGGVEVICFLDSNEKRQERPLAGRPILPPTWLVDHGGEVDAVLISSERPRSEALVRLVQNHLAVECGDVPVLNWQDLV